MPIINAEINILNISNKNMTAQNKNQKGFTLIELLVVIGILAILLAITLIAINPAHQFAQANNTKRRSDVLQILNAIGQYTAENKGQLPDEIVTDLVAGTPVEVADGTVLGESFCQKLLGQGAFTVSYLPALPTNPTNNTNDVTDCTAGTGWATGYLVEKDASNRITVSANPTDEGVIVEVTR